MHETAKRLYQAMSELHGVTGKSAVADRLNVSPQTVHNWEKRGVSSDAAIRIQTNHKISSTWLTHGTGQMTFAATVEGSFPISPTSYKRVWVIGKGQGGVPERVWTDGDYPVGASDEYAEVASADAHAFLVQVVDVSMVPRYQPGEYAMVEPGTEPDLEDDVLVRLTTGETMLKRLLSRRDGWRFGSYNDPAVLNYSAAQVAWVYYVAHPVPARKIKSRH